MPITVTITYSPAPREVWEEVMQLPDGATVRDAVFRSGVFTTFPALDPSRGGVGVWGRKAPAAQILRDGDRVEIYRPLEVDPKVARRERFQKQGARTSGLFARRRRDSKAGY